MGIAERRARDRQNMRRLILDTAMALFVENGYENVSIRKIAAKIEYSPATIYLYFKDKDEIFYVLHEEGFEELLRRQKTTLAIPDPAERIKRLGQIYVEFGLENPQYYDLMFIMNAPLRKIEGEWGCGIEVYNFFCERVTEAITQNRIKAANVEVAAVALWAYVHGLVSITIRDRMKMIPDEERRALIRAVQAFFNDHLLHPGK